MQIILNDFGEYLSIRNNNTFAVYKNKKLIREIPFHHVTQVVLSSGNTLSTTALAFCGFYNIDVLLISKSGKPLSMLMPLKSESRAKTRIKQYQAYFNHKGVEIAKALVKTKIENQAVFLERHGFNVEGFRVKLDKLKGKNVKEVRTTLTGIEGRCSGLFFRRYIKLFPKCLRPSLREKRYARQPMNNVLNFSYEILKGEIYKSVINAHLDPYIGFLHSLEFGKPSLVCDMQELFRIVIEQFVLDYATTLDPKDSFEMKGERAFLTTKEKNRLIRETNKLFSSRIKHHRLTFGKRCEIRTAIKEEPTKLALYIRNQKPTYEPLTIISKIKQP